MGVNHDQAFLQILREERNITNFLDAFFGFLYRCTDFYIESNTEQGLGFPPGLIKDLVLNSMYKCKSDTTVLKETICPVNDSTNSVSYLNAFSSLQNEDINLAPATVHKVVIDSCNKLQDINASSAPSSKTGHTSDSYNGAIRENYVWSQTFNDLDVLINIPEYIRTSKNVKVNINSDEIKIEAKSSISMENSKWDSIFDGKLHFKIRKDESVWSIVPGKYISIHLEKTSERWWEALLVGESKIELSGIDCSRNFDDMALAEQLKVEELMWNHQQKLLGKPTSEQIKMETVLKQAWNNAKGSPFQGTSYNSSILRYD